MSYSTAIHGLVKNVFVSLKSLSDQGYCIFL